MSKNHCSGVRFTVIVLLSFFDHVNISCEQNLVLGMSTLFLVGCCFQITPRKSHYNHIELWCCYGPWFPGCDRLWSHHGSPNLRIEQTNPILNHPQFLWRMITGYNSWFSSTNRAAFMSWCTLNHPGTEIAQSGFCLSGCSVFSGRNWKLNYLWHEANITETQGQLVITRLPGSALKTAIMLKVVQSAQEDFDIPYLYASKATRKAKHIRV